MKGYRQLFVINITTFSKYKKVIISNDTMCLLWRNHVSITTFHDGRNGKYSVHVYV